MDPLVRGLHAHVRDPRRVDAYYAPLARSLASRVPRRAHRPWIVGIQGPQGSGKSTLAAALVAALDSVGRRAVAVSIDDFYLTHAEQNAVTARHPDNPLLRYRGFAGTHDVALGRTVIDALRSLPAGAEFAVPGYDKSAHGGRGDRAPRDRWRTVAGPLDVIVLEGWMLGFSAVPPDASESLASDLRVSNELLRAYGAWNETLDILLHLDVDSLATIVRWRVDAERARRARGEVGLSDEDARDYIERFLPVYRCYVPRLREHPPCADSQRIVLGDDRMPIAALAFP